MKMVKKDIYNIFVIDKNNSKKNKMVNSLILFPILFAY